MSDKKSCNTNGNWNMWSGKYNEVCNGSCNENGICNGWWEDAHGSSFRNIICEDVRTEVNYVREVGNGMKSSMEVSAEMKSAL